MAKKVPYTPNNRIRSSLYRLFLKSRERNRAMKKGVVCVECGSSDNLQCHHIRGIDWDRIFKVIREELLTDDLEPLCKECHAVHTKMEVKEG